MRGFNFANLPDVREFDENRGDILVLGGAIVSVGAVAVTFTFALAFAVPVAVAAFVAFVAVVAVVAFAFAFVAVTIDFAFSVVDAFAFTNFALFILPKGLSAFNFPDGLLWPGTVGTFLGG